MARGAALPLVLSPALQAAREEGRGDPKRLKSDGRKPKWGSFKENYALLKKLSEM